MSDQDLPVPAPVEVILSEREKAALSAYKRQPGQVRLSADAQAKMFALFLHGHSCEEIRSTNKQYALGQILMARLEGKWDERRTEHIEALYDSVRSRVQQSTMEAIGFVADQMAAVHKMYGDRARKYIQSGDPSDFDSYGANDIKNYKVLIETLQKLTGQEQASTEVNVTNQIEKEVVIQNQPFSATRAAELISLQLAAKNQK